MSTLAFKSLKNSTPSSVLVGVQNTASRAVKRCAGECLVSICVTDLRPGFHQSPTQNAIMMPAMSPFMTEGTITRWKIREGEAFSVGDVLLQIVSDYVATCFKCLIWSRLQESDIAMIDVEAQSAGILGKILVWA